MTNKYRETLIVIDFEAYGKDKTEFFFDVTYDQAINYIWDKMCYTAVIKDAWQYGVVDPIKIKITKSKLSDDELNKKIKKY